MMRTIEVDDDIYAHIAANTHEIGESASSILRRLLNLEQAQGDPSPTESTHELSEILASPKLRAQFSAVDSFLFILGEAYKQHRDDFDSILAVQGRERRYFAKSKEEIEASGQSTQPKQIPGSPYWVMTNSPTTQKKQMLLSALRAIGYSDAAANAAARQIR